MAGPARILREMGVRLPPVSPVHALRAPGSAARCAERHRGRRRGGPKDRQHCHPGASLRRRRKGRLRDRVSAARAGASRQRCISAPTAPASPWPSTSHPAKPPTTPALCLPSPIAATIPIHSATRWKPEVPRRTAPADRRALAPSLTRTIPVRGASARSPQVICALIKGNISFCSLMNWHFFATAVKMSLSGTDSV